MQMRRVRAFASLVVGVYNLREILARGNFSTSMEKCANYLQYNHIHYAGPAICAMGSAEAFVSTTAFARQPTHGELT